ncbi:hypothetical protein [Celeribacter sp. PS-C1]|uniref:hypothetical protein n=1 Tax=Celeribacter sp. PS-C1 TaxID=2820813 RepID=UPI001CA58E9B|nr:hypothetical protein [Celeribacter sp. PS-C1]MBW6417499.1 hypothetical protein [Celeribacter sp. PS-C1]
MQISSAAQLWAQSRLRQDPQDPKTAAQDAGGSSVAADTQNRKSASKDTDQSEGPWDTSAARKTIRGAADVFAKYDLTKITPAQIDALTADLKVARFDDLGFAMSLERQGAAYHAEMEASGSVYGIGDEDFDADAPVDLIAKTRSELALAQRYGQDTVRLSTQLFKLEEAQMSRASGASAPSSAPQLAETLVLFQAQRLWVE